MSKNITLSNGLNDIYRQNFTVHIVYDTRATKTTMHIATSETKWWWVHSKLQRIQCESCHDEQKLNSIRMTSMIQTTNIIIKLQMNLSRGLNMTRTEMWKKMFHCRSVSAKGGECKEIDQLFWNRGKDLTQNKIELRASLLQYTFRLTNANGRCQKKNPRGMYFLTNNKNIIQLIQWAPFERTLAVKVCF